MVESSVERVPDVLRGRGASGPLSAEERLRYSRHLSVPEIGDEGQRRLRRARVLVVGSGGLGSPVLMYLAAAGIGTLGLVDDDAVDVSNLQRQVIHSAMSVGVDKVTSAGRFIRDLNDGVTIRAHHLRLTVDNVLEVVDGYDIVVDCTDNFEARYLVNDAAVRLGIPCVWGAVYQMTGQVSVFWSPYGPCYGCVFPEPPPLEITPLPAVGGVLGAVCGIVGSMQAAEVVKLIAGTGEPLVGRMLVIDAATSAVRSVTFDRDLMCPACGGGEPAMERHLPDEERPQMREGRMEQRWR